MACFVWHVVFCFLQISSQKGSYEVEFGRASFSKSHILMLIPLLCLVLIIFLSRVLIMATNVSVHATDIVAVSTRTV